MHRHERAKILELAGRRYEEAYTRLKAFLPHEVTKLAGTYNVEADLNAVASYVTLLEADAITREIEQMAAEAAEREIT